MLIISSVLLVVNIFLMFFFFFKIKRQFSPEVYRDLMQQRMRSILMDFNLQTDQAITILEDRMNELKNLISDADRCFKALSNKLDVIGKFQNIDRDVVVEKNNEKLIPETSKNVVAENKGMVYSGYEGIAKKDEFTRRRIIDMSKSGWANDYISQKLSIPLAEVELILFMEGRE